MPTKPGRSAWGAGHYYNPIPSADEVARTERRAALAAVPSLAGIDLQPNVQLAYLSDVARYAPSMPFRESEGHRLRFFFKNGMFLKNDAAVLYGFLRSRRPKRIIEIGSGHSSALMLDVNELHPDTAAELTFVEPYADRLRKRMRAGDAAAIVDQPVQEVDLRLFDQLEDGDLLFVDSSHVVKLGSDVNWIVSYILPRLAPGVYVHFHDIGYPFEYWEDWVQAGYVWSEAYLLRAFLQYNAAFEIIYFSDYLARFYPEEERMALGAAVSPRGQSLWLRRRLPLAQPPGSR